MSTPFKIVDGVEVPLSPDEITAFEARAAQSLLVTRAQVDAERDRRTAENFTFAGKAFQLDEKSIGRITAMGAAARFAISEGALEGDYFWADPEQPFGFIASDNTVVPMDAQTMKAFSGAAMLWVSRLTFAGLVLKSQDPIPADFTADSYWSA